jgi:uncharacterized protein with HEPN domain
VPVNPEVVRSKLLDIGEAVSRLRSWLPITPERLEQDGMLRWAVEHGLLASSTAKRLDSLSGFRNVLVHDYAKVDVRRVHAGLARLDDFEAFVADVEMWLARTSH